MRQKIFDRTELATQIAARRQAAPDFELVFTNGCFDLLHVGHVRYLWETRQQGSALCVALNDDDSVRRLKGATRPILALRERLEIIAGLECVDYVTWFDEDTPIPLLELLKPEVLIKGANYSVDGVVGKDVAEGWGARVSTLALTDNSSTTNLIERVLAMRASKD
jgi:D-beta-D-heptose 7-phosphate kinase / D-beta-D-heptose 1-phosphate adenosyltransferase